MADGRHLEKFNKRPYLWNGLTDLHEIWHGGANWHVKAYLQLEFQTSEKLFSFPLLLSLRPFPCFLLFSCSLPTPLNPSHSSTLGGRSAAVNRYAACPTAEPWITLARTHTAVGQLGNASYEVGIQCECVCVCVCVCVRACGTSFIQL